MRLLWHCFPPHGCLCVFVCRQLCSGFETPLRWESGLKWKGPRRECPNVSAQPIAAAPRCVQRQVPDEVMAKEGCWQAGDATPCLLPGCGKPEPVCTGMHSHASGDDPASREPASSGSRSNS